MGSRYEPRLERTSSGPENVPSKNFAESEKDSFNAPCCEPWL